MAFSRGFHGFFKGFMDFLDSFERVAWGFVRFHRVSLGCTGIDRVFSLWRSSGLWGVTGFMGVFFHTGFRFERVEWGSLGFHRASEV